MNRVISSTEIKKIRTRAKRLVRQGIEYEAMKVLKANKMSLRDLTEAALMAIVSFAGQEAEHRDTFIELMLESKESYNNCVKAMEKEIIKEHNKIRSA